MVFSVQLAVQDLWVWCQHHRYITDTTIWKPSQVIDVITSFLNTDSNFGQFTQKSVRKSALFWRKIQVISSLSAEVKEVYLSASFFWDMANFLGAGAPKVREKIKRSRQANARLGNSSIYQILLGKGPNLLAPVFWPVLFDSFLRTPRSSIWSPLNQQSDKLPQNQN